MFLLTFPLILNRIFHHQLTVVLFSLLCCKHKLFLKPHKRISPLSRLDFLWLIFSSVICCASSLRGPLPYKTQFWVVVSKSLHCTSPKHFHCSPPVSVCFAPGMMCWHDMRQLHAITCSSCTVSTHHWDQCYSQWFGHMLCWHFIAGPGWTETSGRLKNHQHGSSKRLVREILYLLLFFTIVSCL